MNTLEKDISDLITYDDVHCSDISCKEDHYEHMVTVINKLRSIAVEHNVDVCAAKENPKQYVPNDGNWVDDLIDGVGDVIGEVLS